MTQKKKECEEQRIYRGTGRKKEYDLFLVSALRTSNSSAAEVQFRHALGKVELDDDSPCEKEDIEKSKKEEEGGEERK